MTVSLAAFFIFLIISTLRAEPYAAWINVPIKVTEPEANRGQGEPAPGAEVKAITGKLLLAKVTDRGHVPPSTLNTLICRQIASRAIKINGRLLVHGTRIIENSFEGPILELVRAISNELRGDLLLEPAEVGSFVPLELDDPKKYQIIPVKLTFDLGTVLVLEGEASEPFAVNCPGVLPMFERGHHFRRSSLLHLATIVIIGTLILIVVGVKVLS